MAGEFPAISPFQQVIAPLASLGSYDVEIAYRSDGIIGDYAVFSGVAAGAGRSEEHTSELQSLMRSSYAVFCLKKKQTQQKTCRNTHSIRLQLKTTHYHI